MSDMDSGQETAAPVAGQFDLFTGAEATTTEWGVRYVDRHGTTSVQRTDSEENAGRVLWNLLQDDGHGRPTAAAVVSREVGPWTAVAQS